MDIAKLAEGLRETAEVLARSSAARGPDLAAASKLAAKIESLADRQLPQLSEGGIPLDCAPRCCHCCHQMILASPAEIVRLVDTVAEWGGAGRNELRERLKSYTEAAEPDRAEGFVRTRLACPFLVDELCTVYEQRPLMCRGLTSASAKACEDYRLNARGAPPFGPNGEMGITAALRQGLALNDPSAATLEMPLVVHQVLNEGLDATALLIAPEQVRRTAERPWHKRFSAGVEDPLGAPIISAERVEYLRAVMAGPLEEALPILQERNTTNMILRIMSPQGYRSVDDVNRWREHFVQAIEDAWDFEPWDAAEAYHAVCDVSAIGPGHQPFSMRAPMERFGRLLHDRIAQKVAPELLEPLGKRKPGKARLGFAGNLGLNSGSSWIIPMIKRLNPEAFETYTLKTYGPEDAASFRIKDIAAHYYRLAGHPLEMARFIRSLDLDYLVFPEIGGITAEYQLAIFRLARTQALGWGCPFTSGLPTIDHYLSAESMEAPDGEAEYTEQLIRLPHTGQCLSPAPTFDMGLDRSHFGLPDGFLVSFAQHPIKWMPEWDELLARIVKARNGTLVAFDFAVAYANACFQQRMDALGVPVLWKKRMDPYLFRNFLRLCDVNVDSPAWSGGLTTIECLVAGAPIVSLPGKFLRQRLALGFCRMTGVEGLCARDEEDYFDLATSPDRLREAMRGLEVSALIEDVAPVRALEEVVLGTGSGSGAREW